MHISIITGAPPSRPDQIAPNSLSYRPLVYILLNYSSIPEIETKVCTVLLDLTTLVPIKIYLLNILHSFYSLYLDGTCPSSIPRGHPVVLEFLSPMPKWPYEVLVFLAWKNFCPLLSLHPLRHGLVLGIRWIWWSECNTFQYGNMGCSEYMVCRWRFIMFQCCLILIF